MVQAVQEQETMYSFRISAEVRSYDRNEELTSPLSAEIPYLILIVVYIHPNSSIEVTKRNDNINSGKCLPATSQVN